MRISISIFSSTLPYNDTHFQQDIISTEHLSYRYSVFEMYAIFIITNVKNHVKSSYNLSYFVGNNMISKTLGWH